MLRDTGKGESEIHIILDIDDVLTNGFEVDTLDELLKQQPEIKPLIDEHLFIHAIYPHFIHPGVIEFMQWLFRLPKIKVSFFSDSPKKRIEAFVHALFKLAWGQDSFKIIESTSIYSREDMKKATIEKKERQFKLFNVRQEPMKKNLKKALKTKFLDNVMMIDNSFGNVPLGQERNFLIVNGIGYEQFCKFHRYKETYSNEMDKYILPMNHTFCIVGMINKIINMKSNCLADNLFNFQYKKVEDGYRHNAQMEDEHQYYFDGLSELKKINSKIEFYGGELAEKYFRKHKLAKRLAEQVHFQDEYTYTVNNTVPYQRKDTVLHYAAKQKDLILLQSLSTCLSSGEWLELLSIKNQQRKTALQVYFLNADEVAGGTKKEFIMAFKGPMTDEDWAYHLKSMRLSESIQKIMMMTETHYLQPRPEHAMDSKYQHALDKEYLKSQYSGMANYQFRKSDTLLEWYAAQYNDQYDLSTVDDILEIGCGDGTFWKYVTNGRAFNPRVVITDYVKKMLDTCKENLAATPMNATFQVADIDALTFKPATFSAVLAHKVIYHAQNPNQSIIDMRALLKPNGFLGLSVLNTGAYQSIWKVANEIESRIPDASLSSRFSDIEADKILLTLFSTVTTKTYTSKKQFNNSDAVVDFVRSNPIVQPLKLGENFFCLFKAKVDEVIKDKGVFDCEYNSNLYLCRK